MSKNRVRKGQKSIPLNHQLSLMMQFVCSIPPYGKYVFCNIDDEEQYT